MAGAEFHVVGADHIDLAWKKGSREMSELLESFVVRLLDLLEAHPRLTYVIEQAAHYRKLEARRPDLVRRIERYVAEGRVEVVGCMASTLETNLPCGESFVRNQLLGIRWFREHLHASPTVGWLIDTFGVNAQVPQILRQFGVKYLMANRFGGEKTADVFHAQGLDGTRVLVAGRDVFSPCTKGPRVLFRFTTAWKDIDALFDEGEGLDAGGPYLIMPYVENEVLPSSRIVDNVERCSRGSSGATYRYSLPRDFFRALEAAGTRFPVMDGDLNPEFTGCYSQRIGIRLANRRAEALLLEAEMWLALRGSAPQQSKGSIDEAWWLMAFNHFHDVFTGSHPTSVMEEVLGNYREVERIAHEMLRTIYGDPVTAAPSRPGDLTAVNSLPWPRREVVSLPLDSGSPGAYRVESEGTPVASAVEDGRLRFVADIPAAGARRFRITRTGGSQGTGAWRTAESAVVENERIRVEVDRHTGIRSLVWRETGKLLLDQVGDFLTLQRDDGTFQYEMPTGSEIHADAGELDLEVAGPSPAGQRCILSGAFPPVGDCSESPARWSLELAVPAEVPKVDLELRVQWRGEACRLRLKLPTTLDAAGGVYEIPFGAVRRRPYSPGFNKKGEWPAQRFVAVEDGEHGLALVNTGVAGVEARGGTMWTTLLRAPRHEYAGMVPDDTSSQHGSHSFSFALVPYRGSWRGSPLLRLAQELNSPVRLFHGSPVSGEGSSSVEIEDPAVVLASVKIPEDGTSGDCVLRLYEATGAPHDCTLKVEGATQAWLTDLAEQTLEPLECRGGAIRVSLAPFQIRSIRVRRG